jgi:hypothetical protein
MPYDESIGMSVGSPDILSMQAMPAHTIDLQDLPHGTFPAIHIHVSLSLSRSRHDTTRHDTTHA